MSPRWPGASPSSPSRRAATCVPDRPRSIRRTSEPGESSVVSRAVVVPSSARSTAAGGTVGPEPPWGVYWHELVESAAKLSCVDQAGLAERPTVPRCTRSRRQFPRTPTRLDPRHGQWRRGKRQDAETRPGRIRGFALTDDSRSRVVCTAPIPRPMFTHSRTTPARLWIGASAVVDAGSASLRRGRERLQTAAAVLCGRLSTGRCRRAATSPRRSRHHWVEPSCRVRPRRSSTLACPDVHRDAAESSGRGGTIRYPRFEVPGRVILASVVKDPAGNSIGLVEMENGMARVPSLTVNQSRRGTRAH